MSGSTDMAGRLERGGAPAAGGTRSLVHRGAAWHLLLIAAYLAAGVGVTWPRAAYLTGRLPRTRDVSNYVWCLQWLAHQVIQLGNPWFTTQLAAPAGVQLAFDTTMPLVGVVMTPLTLAFGPAAGVTLLSIAAPGLACYVMYRAARLWLAQPGAIAAGALFGLSSILAWQAWYHLNMALGTLFLPMALEAAVRLRRQPGRRQGVILGLVLGASVLVNQESAVLAALLSALILVPWLLGAARAALGPAGGTAPRVGRGVAPGGAAGQPPGRARAAITAVAVAVLVAGVVASPQLIAMAQQVAAGGASIAPNLLARTYRLYGVGLPTLVAPSPRLRDFGLGGLAGAYIYREPDEGVVTYGVLLSVLALGGLAVRWRRWPARWLALLWVSCAALALGPTLIIGHTHHVPLAGEWHGSRLSWLMPFTWLVHLPGLSGLREADRFILLGLVGAAVLAGAAVDWLSRPARPLIAVAAAAAIFETGWSGTPGVGTMPTTLPRLDRPIAADHSGSIVVDVPYGLRGGIPLFGSPIVAQAQLLATSDGHPRAISYTAWVPVPTVQAIRKHPFYVRLAAAQGGHLSSPGQLALARADARRMGIGWVLVWHNRRAAVRYLTGVGFRFGYRADRVSVYRPGW